MAILNVFLGVAERQGRGERQRGVGGESHLLLLFNANGLYKCLILIIQSAHSNLFIPINPNKVSLREGRERSGERSGAGSGVEWSGATD